MNNNPLVSIIIPAYNHARYIQYTLNSVIADTYPNKEIIIINDGSTDSTDEVIRSWIALNGKNIEVNYNSRENKGVSKTLNEAIKLAKGKYILPVASDDVLYGNTIAQRVAILDENEKNNKLVLISDAFIIDENSNVTGESSMALNKGDKLKFKTERDILKEMILRPSTVGAIVLINRLVYDKIGNYPEDLLIEDWTFYQRAAAIKSILFWDEPVSLYRVHSTNMSGPEVSIERKLAITKSIIIAIYRNISWFPGFYFKSLAVRKMAIMGLRVLKSRLEFMITNS